MLEVNLALDSRPASGGGTSAEHSLREPLCGKASASCYKGGVEQSKL